MTGINIATAGARRLPQSPAERDIYFDSMLPAWSAPVMQPSTAYSAVCPGTLLQVVPPASMPDCSVYELPETLSHVAAALPFRSNTVDRSTRDAHQAITD